VHLSSVLAAQNFRACDLSPAAKYNIIYILIVGDTSLPNERFADYGVPKETAEGVKTEKSVRLERRNAKALRSFASAYTASEEKL